MNYLYGAIVCFGGVLICIAWLFVTVPLLVKIGDIISAFWGIGP